MVTAEVTAVVTADVIVVGIVAEIVLRIVVCTVLTTVPGVVVVWKAVQIAELEVQNQCDSRTPLGPFKRMVAHAGRADALS